ncbi:hypothetical protein TWF706_010928 [Orbilia oligospora]|nr:hypothetical protein TWF706_010928 [Orbilia oligospora]
MLLPRAIQRGANPQDRKGRKVKKIKYRQRLPCVLHFDTEGAIVRFENFDTLATHMKSCGRGLIEGYKCGGGVHEDCKKAWKESKYKDFAEHTTNQHPAENPRDPQFKYGVAAGGYYCGFCVQRIPTTTHRSLLEYLRESHFEQKELTDIKLWVSSHDVDMSRRGEAIQCARGAFTKEIALNPQPFDLAQIARTSGVEEALRAPQDPMTTRVDRRDLLPFQPACSEGIEIELDYGPEG